MFGTSSQPLGTHGHRSQHPPSTAFPMSNSQVSQKQFLVAPSHPVPLPFSFLVFRGSLRISPTEKFSAFSGGSENGQPKAVVGRVVRFPVSGSCHPQAACWRAWARTCASTSWASASCAGPSQKTAQPISPKACGALFSARTTLPEPSQNLVEPWWIPRGTYKLSCSVAPIIFPFFGWLPH